MTAHVVFPAFEPDAIPATLSKRILTGLLRETLGFEGLIVTDCLEMNAVAQTIGVARGAVQAVKSGADLVLVSHRLSRQKAAMEALLDAVHAGEIPESRIDEAVARVWNLKRVRNLFGAAPASPDPAAAAETARRLSEKAVTAVRGGHLLPLPKDVPVTVIWTEPRAGTEVIEVIPQQWTLGAALNAEGYRVNEVRIGIVPTDEEEESARKAAAEGGSVVFVSYDACFSAKQTALIRSLAAAPERRFVLTASRTPYDGVETPEVSVYLCTYENKPAMMTALAGVISGRISAAAELPVTIGGYVHESGRIG